MPRKRSRTWAIFGAGVLIAGSMIYAFWPRPTMVDMGEAKHLPMMVTIDEEAKTRVHDAYVVAAPIAGQLLRVDVVPGDVVKGGQSVIARMVPANPPALDIRTQEQARAAVSSAEAALRVARADLKKARAEKEYAELDLKRKRNLSERGISTKAALDQAEWAWHAANATLDMATATISMREADLANARARLITFTDPGAPPKSRRPVTVNSIPITAPVSGRILRVMQESETTVVAGTPILEIGDISNDLEVVAELLSTDAVQVSAGNRVIIRKWGGSDYLNGLVERVEPWGFTKVSALGVEEQRVKVIIKFTDPPARRRTLGHGFRVETQIVVWEDKDTLTTPSSALFRQNGSWTVFKLEHGRARLTPVKVEHNNGQLAEIKVGLEAGDRVVLYPGPNLTDGARVTPRAVE